MITDEVVKAAYEKAIAKYYVDYLEQYHKDPTSKEFTNFLVFEEKDAENGVTSWKDVFKNISEVRSSALKQYPEDVAKYTFTENDFGTKDYLKKSKEFFDSHKKFIISTAVNNKPVNIEFLNAIKNYAEKNNAAIGWCVSHDVRSAKREFTWNLDPALKCGHVITGDITLNNNLMISGVTASAKQINTLSGYTRLCSKLQKTIIFPGCKQFLEHIAELPAKVKNRTPFAAICMGAVTIPDYSNDKIMSGRTSYLAEIDHQLGAIVIEIENEEIFHVRLVQAGEDNSITDLGLKYYPDGSVGRVDDTIAVLGDLHVGGPGFNEELFNKKLEFLRDNDHISEVIIHDIDNSTSISHHEENNIILKFFRHEDGHDDIVKEGNAIVRCLNKLAEIASVKKITIVNSNHDRHIEKWLQDLRVINKRDLINFKPAIQMMSAWMEDRNLILVKKLIEDITDEKLVQPEKLNWLGRDEEYSKYGVELGRHGDEGSNGGKGSIRTYETSLSNAVIAHSHSGRVFRNLFQVGTNSSMNMGYNHGLSSWTHTDCLVYANGTKQLVDFIPKVDGGYTYRA